MELSLLYTYPDNHIDCVWNIKFHPIYNIFASCGSDKKIQIWEFSEPEHQYIKTSILDKTHTSIIRSIDWDYSGKYLSAASFDKNISIWQITNDNSPYKFKCLNVIESSDSEIKSVSWSVSGKYLASCSRKGNIWIWEKDVDEFEGEDFICKSTFEAHKGDIKNVKFSPREDILFSCGFDETIKIWDYNLSKDDFELINSLKQHGGTVWFLEFNKIGDKFFSCSDDKSLVLWGIDFKNENPYMNVNKLAILENIHSRPIYSCSLTFNENYILTAGNDGDINIIKVIDDKLELIYKKKEAHEKYGVNCVSCNKNNNLIASCGDDCSIKIWELKEK